MKNVQWGVVLCCVGVPMLCCHVCVVAVVCVALLCLCRAGGAVVLALGRRCASSDLAATVSAPVLAAVAALSRSSLGHAGRESVVSTRQIEVELPASTFCLWDTEERDALALQVSLPWRSFYGGGTHDVAIPAGHGTVRGALLAP